MPSDSRRTMASLSGAIRLARAWTGGPFVWMKCSTPCYVFSAHKWTTRREVIRTRYNASRVPRGWFHVGLGTTDTLVYTCMLGNNNKHYTEHFQRDFIHMSDNVNVDFSNDE